MRVYNHVHAFSIQTEKALIPSCKVLIYALFVCLCVSVCVSVVVFVYTIYVCIYI